MTDTTPNQIKFIRPSENTVYTQSGVFPGWGKYFEPIADPEASNISKELIKGKFFVKKDFPKIPAVIYSAIIKLFEHWVHVPGLSGGQEAQVLLYRDWETHKEWKAVVPLQYVGPASTRKETDIRQAIGVDLLTGETYSILPMSGYYFSGDIHSHVQMQSFFSSIDDKDDIDKNGYHGVIGEVTTNNVLTSSIVFNRVRRIINNEDIVDTTIIPGVTFHPKVLDMVRPLEVIKPKPVNKSQAGKWSAYRKEYEFMESGDLYRLPDDSLPLKEELFEELIQLISTIDSLNDRELTHRCLKEILGTYEQEMINMFNDGAY
jgi:hypothetical protein